MKDHFDQDQQDGDADQKDALCALTQATFSGCLLSYPGFNLTLFDETSGGTPPPLSDLNRLPMPSDGRLVCHPPAEMMRDWVIEDSAHGDVYDVMCLTHQVPGGLADPQGVPVRPAAWAVPGIKVCIGLFHDPSSGQLL